MKFKLFVVGLLSSLSVMAFADEAVVAKAQPSFFENIIPFLLIFVLMYFLLIRPQVKKAKEHASLVSGLQVGDEVVTSGGIIGRIRSISEGFVVLDLGSTTVKVLKENISRTSHPKSANGKVVVKETKEEK